MLRLALYETLCGNGSPHRWAQEAQENAPLQWLLRGTKPSVRACYRFRDRLGQVVETLHADIIHRAQDERLCVAPEVVAQDGSFHRACASRHRLVNQDQLHKRRRQLEEVIQAEAAGREPAEAAGVEPAATAGVEPAATAGGEPAATAPYWMPKTPTGRADLCLRMEKAGEILQQRLETNARKRKSHRLDEKHVCVSLSDPEAAISRDKEKVFCPLYTAQYMTDYCSGLVLGFQVTAAATDVGTLIPMIDKVQPLVGGTIKKVCTDSTYATVLELKACQERNIELIALVQENSWTEKNRQRPGAVSTSNKLDFLWLDEEQTYQCPDGHKLQFQYQEHAERAGGRKVTMSRYHCAAEHCLGCRFAPSCVKDASRGRTIKRLEGQELLDAQRERMKQADAREILRYRSAVVERTIADTKEHRDGRRLHGRGLARATAEIGLKLIAQNLLTLHRLRKAAANSHEDTS
jgi:transposase